VPIAFLAALVAGMALVAGGVVGDRFGFHDWPMSPAPQMAQHVTVSHPRIVTDDPATTRVHKTSPATVAAGSADQTLPADSAPDQARLVSEHTQPGVRHPAPHEHGSSSPTNDGDVSDGAGTVDASPGTHTGSTQSSTPAAPPSTTTTSGNEVTAASTDMPTPARTEETPPADPQPTPPADPAPTPPADPTPTPPPPTSGGGNGQGTGHPGRHHGPIRQLLHDLLGLGNVQD
jgi:hypothetical protein